MESEPQITLDLLREFAADPRTTSEQRSAILRYVNAPDDLGVDLGGIPAYEEWNDQRHRWLRAHTRPGEHGLIDTTAETITTLDENGNEVVAPLPPETAQRISELDAHLATERTRALSALEDLTTRARDLQAQLDELERQISPLLSDARERLSVPLKDLQKATGYTHNQIYSRIQAPQDETSQRARAGERRNPSTYVTKGPGVGVREAARQLGISETAVRKRVAAGTLAHTYAENGRLRILLDA
ncbi:hypothetical protein ABE10_11425 [Bacillus toyonensis]|nr:hypothetical protein [Bacillus toyonensis]